MNAKCLKVLVLPSFPNFDTRLLISLFFANLDAN